MTKTHCSSNFRSFPRRQRSDYWLAQVNLENVC